jgi:hypothetical protein
LDELESSENVDERKEEAIGMRWLLMTPHIPAPDALSLGKRAIALAGDDVKDRGAPLWDRLIELAETDARGTYEIAEPLIHEALARDYVYLPFESVAPTLAKALNSSDEQIRKRAKRLIHTLGDHDLFEYGKLLDSGRQAEENN